ncbi:MAG: hypothetical protein ABI321_23090 [Polyangia bacterium]
MRFLLALLVIGLPSFAHAQANNQISFAAIMKAPVGSWAEYVMSKDGEAETVNVRYTLVQRDAKHIALEIDSKTPMGHMLMRLQFDPDGARWKLAKAKVKVGTGDARDAPLPPDDPSNVFGKEDDFGKKVGHESVSTAGGKRETTHFRRKTEGEEGQLSTDVWIDDKVFPVGLVKLTDGRGSKVELAATGTGGTTQLK